MARYTHLLTVAVPLGRLYEQVTDLLKSCNFEVLYLTEDYLIAREQPGKVPFPKLVTVEVLVDNTRATKDRTQLNFVIKNEELPLKSNNHCFQVYQQLNQALSENKGWSLVASVAGAEG
ncbi:hypothetical protein GS597_00975 [Synechococcales cyanobacterium C]|uniref:Uncharacterized protein n=1 Tax=Petrachloros mirabilis ULC683 TaxID=2781853 RepID=A0A8K1ZVZ8_9CYAN|nr:hypothetical protein [Petrachloros mirabilis]NCJ05111.1 hypothetical protein [Petrachloros mirabilis ULC683]